MPDGNIRFTLIMGVSSISAFLLAKISQLLLNMGPFGFAITMFCLFFLLCLIIDRAAVGSD